MNLCYTFAAVFLVFATVVRCEDFELYELPPEQIPETDPTYDESEDEEAFVAQPIKRSVHEALENRRRRTADELTEVLGLSNLFYNAQQSGPLPPWNSVDWRGNSALSDVGNNGEDLTGGWYDAGDHVKFNYPMAYTATFLAWGYIEFKEAYDLAQQSTAMEDNLRFVYDYFMKCHPEKNVLYYQIGNAGMDHKWWGRAEDMTMDRPAYRCGEGTGTNCSDVAGEISAAMSTCVIIFKDTDPEYAAKCERHARELYDFAMEYRGTYPDPTYYPSSWYYDELCWASTWLHLVTGEQHYLQTCETWFADKYKRLKSRAYSFSWMDKKPGLKLLLYKCTQNDGYKTKFISFLKNWLPGMRLPYTPKGLVFRSSWGSARYAATTAALATIAHKYGMDIDGHYLNWAESQIDYILGDDTRQGYVVGFGPNSPKKPHHRSSSCPPPGTACTGSNSFKRTGPNPGLLKGACVGGPDGNDHWVDDRKDYVKNEVACDYNAGFQTAVAGLIHCRHVQTR